MGILQLVWDFAVFFILMIFLILAYWRIFRTLKRKTIACCGHKTEVKGYLQAFGEKQEIKLIRDKKRTFEYCIDCLGKMTICCAWCGRPIFIGSLITLYTPIDNNFKISEYAVIYKENPLQLVGCPRSDCAETGADYCGYWVPPGKVERFKSMFEESIADLKAGGSGVISRNF